MKMKLLFLTLLLACSISGFGQFITEWNTNASTSIIVPTTGTGYNYTATIALLSSPSTIITTLSGVTGNATFAALTENTAYEIKISGAFPRIYMNGGGQKLKLKKITQWGNNAWTSFNNAFSGCATLNITATDVPILTGVTDMSSMFASCSILNGPANIGTWNTSTIINMKYMFSAAAAFNQNINSWNTGSVTDMTGMFGGTLAFNHSLNNWNTSSVTDMSGMFMSSGAFNSGINNWDTSAVTNMAGMFQSTVLFNQSIDNWNTAAVTDMGNMFYGAKAYNQSMNNWDTGSVTNMNSMFRESLVFNGDIGNWDTSAVTEMGSMFYKATNFNKPIGDWNIEAVQTAMHMFELASSFNQPLGDWNPISMWNMSFMFQQASAFNQDIGNWNVSSVLHLDAMFKQATSFDHDLAGWAETLNPAVNGNSSFGGFLENCGMSAANYDATLIGFNESGPNGISIGAAGLFYCNEGAAARANLVLPEASGGKGWIILGDTSLSTSTPLLAAPNTTTTLINVNCNNDWANPANRARKMLIINENGNSISPTSVLINHNNIGTLPSGVTSATGYYQKSNGTNSTRIGNRLISIADSGIYPINDGVIVRVYYSTAEYSNIVVIAPPVGDIVDAGWFLSEIDNAAGVVANMSAGEFALPSAEKIIPINSGSQNGIAFVEFKLIKFGTIGIYAKTTQGSLAPELSTGDNSSSQKILISPNPVTDNINIQLPVADTMIRTVTITNMLGQVVYGNTANSSTINDEQLQAGVYQIVILTNKGKWTNKFIKSR